MPKICRTLRRNDGTPYTTCFEPSGAIRGRAARLPNDSTPARPPAYTRGDQPPSYSIGSPPQYTDDRGAAPAYRPPASARAVAADAARGGDRAALARIGKAARKQKGKNVALAAAAVAANKTMGKARKGTHKMPDGTLMTGKTHTKDSKPVAPAAAAPKKKAKAKKAAPVKTEMPKAPTQAEIDASVTTRADGTLDTARKRSKEAEKLIFEYRDKFENWLKSQNFTGKELKELAKKYGRTSSGSKQSIIDNLGSSVYYWGREHLGMGNDKKYDEEFNNIRAGEKQRALDKERGDAQAKERSVKKSDAPTPTEVLHWLGEIQKNEITYRGMPRRTYGDAVERSRERFRQKNWKIFGFRANFPSEFEKIKEKALGNVRGMVSGVPIYN